jgi:hypothetical protein
MTPEQHSIYLETYRAALSISLNRAPDLSTAVTEASKLAALAVEQYPAGEPAKRGPGRPPKEVQA